MHALHFRDYRYKLDLEEIAEIIARDNPIWELSLVKVIKESCINIRSPKGRSNTP